MAFNSRVNLFFGRDNLITYHEGPPGGTQEVGEKSGSEVDVCVCVWGPWGECGQCCVISAPCPASQSASLKTHSTTSTEVQACKCGEFTTHWLHNEKFLEAVGCLWRTSWKASARFCPSWGPPDRCARLTYCSFYSPDMMMMMMVMVMTLKVVK